MARWIQLLDHQARLVVTKNRRLNWLCEVAGLKALHAKTQASIDTFLEAKGEGLHRSAADRASRGLPVETLEPRLLFSAELSAASFYADGELKVGYDIAGADASAFDVSVYRSSDGVTLDALVATKRVTDAAELAVGSHEATLTADFVDVQEDYSLIAVVDAAGENAEADETDNTAGFAGGVFVSVDDVVHVHGGAGADTVGVTKPGDVKVTLNGTLYQYNSGDVSAVHVRGHGGADVVDAGSGVNKPVWAFGGEGDDSLTGGGSDDYIIGGVGDDALAGRTGDDIIEGGLGADSIIGDAGNDVLRGGDGADFIDGQENDDLIYGGAGDDVIEGGYGSDTIEGGDGDDDIEGNQHADVIRGDAGNDTIDGGTGADNIDGGHGDDTIFGSQDPDLIWGGPGADVIDAGYGNDTVYGGSGNDFIEGKAGADTLYGQGGDDVLEGDGGSNTLDGGTGLDTVDGVAEGNTTPIASTPAIADVDADTGFDPIAIDLYAGFEDAEHADDELVYTLVGNTDPSLLASATIFEGVLTLESAPGISGQTDLTVRATDTGGLWAETTFTLTVTDPNTAPVALGIPNLEVLEDGDLVTLLLGDYFSDAEDGGAGLTYEVVGNTSPALVMTDVLLPNGETPGITDPQVVIGFAPESSGVAVLTVRATDGAGAFVESSFTVTVRPVDDAPVLEGLDDGPDPAITGADLTLEVQSAWDDSPAMKVDFYRDLDGDGVLDTSVDQLLGLDADGSDGWSVTVSTEGFELGQHRYFAVATDSEGQSSNVITSTGGVGIVGILDDAHPGYVESGTGWTPGSSPDSYDGAHRQAAPGTGDNTAAWSFTGLLEDAPHRIFATWSADAANATNATYTVSDASGVLGTFSVDQTVAPASYFDGSQWWHQLIELPEVDGELTIELTDDADGVVVADAIRVLDPPPTIEYLSGDRASLSAGTDLLLTAYEVIDTDGTVVDVDFYLDDGDGVFNAASDLLIGTDAEGSDDYTALFDTAGMSVGAYRFFAVAEDNSGEFSAAKSFDVTVTAGAADGMIVHYKFDEPSGSFVGDSATSDGAQDGSYNGPRAAGYAGNAINLNGVSQSVNITGYKGILGTNSRTVAAWINTTNGGAVTHWGQASTGGRWTIRVGNASGGGNGALRLETGNGQLVGTTDLRDGQWHHIAVVYDAAGGGDIVNAQLFIDGQLEVIDGAASQTGAFSTNAGVDVRIGHSHSGKRFKGLIDDYRIYDKALTQQEIQSLAPTLPNTAPDVQDATMGITGDGAVGQVLGTVLASDIDTADTLTYEITDGNEDGVFAIDSATGTITQTAVTPDFASQTNGVYKLTVKVTDNGSPNLYRLATVTVEQFTESSGLVVQLTFDDRGESVTGYTTDSADDGGSQDGKIRGGLAFAEDDFGQWSASFNGVNQDLELNTREITGTQTSIGDVNRGVIGYSGGTGTAYLMYSSEMLQTRFTGIHPEQAEHLIKVQHNGTTWQYADLVVGVGDQWFDFTPEADDLLVAEITMIDPGDDALASLEGTAGTIEGIESGFAAGDLVFVDNFYNGVTSRDNHTAEGTYFIRNSDAQVTTTAYKGVTGTQSRSLSTWVKTTRNGAITQWGQLANGKQWTVRIGAASGDGVTDGLLRLEVGGANVIGTTDLRDDQWHHIAVVFDNDGTPTSGDVKLFIDGVEEAYTQKDDVAIDTGSDRAVRIGHSHFGTRFKGLMDDYRIYDRAISQGEIINLIQAAGLDLGITTTIMGTTEGVAAVGTLNPTSPDPNANFNFTLSDGDAGNLFSIDTDGNLTINNTGTFDYAGTYKLTVTVTELSSGVGVSSSFTVINVLPNELVDGLVGLWQFNEGTGTETEDLASANNGTLNGTVEWHGSDVGSNALMFNGVNTSVTVDGYQGITGTNARTVSAWINTADFGSIVSWGNNNAGQLFNLRVNDGSDGTQAGTLRLDVGGGHITGSTTIRDSQWHHVAVTFDATAGGDVTDAKLYVDGYQEGITSSQAQAINTAFAGPVSFGSGAAGGRYTGLLDEVRIYDRALSDTDIATTASAPNTPAEITRLNPWSVLTQGEQMPVEVDIRDFGTRDITQLRLYIDLDDDGTADAGEPVVLIDNPARSLQSVLDTSGLQEGNYTLVAEALDSGGAILSTLSESVVVIDNRPFDSSYGIDVVLVTPDTPIDFDLLRQHEDQYPGQKLQVGAINQPDDGTITLNADGTVHFVPDAGVGASSGVINTFIYTVEDDQGNALTSATARLFIGDTQTPADFTANAAVTYDGQGNPFYTLTIDTGTSVDVSSGAQLVVDWGDGSQPQTAIFVDNGDGTFTIGHALENDLQVFPIRVFASDPAAAGGATYQAAVTVAQAAVSNIDAEALSSSEVRLRWNDLMVGEEGYSISVSSDGGQTYTEVATVGADATSAVVSGLPDSTDLDFTVTPVVGDDPAAFDVAAAAAAAATTTAAPAGPVEVLWEVAILNHNLLINEAGYTAELDDIWLVDDPMTDEDDPVDIIDGDGVKRKYKRVMAESAEAAIWKAIEAYAYISDWDVPPNKFMYDFPDRASFDVGTADDLAAKYNGMGHLGHQHFGLPEYLIALEDTTKLDVVFDDEDNDDWAWLVRARPVVPKVGAFAINAYGAEVDDDVAGIEEDHGAFIITRGEGNTEGELRVFFEVKNDGSEINHAIDSYLGGGSVGDQDYVEQLIQHEHEGKYYGEATIQGGRSSVILNITPFNDGLKEWDEKIIIEVVDPSELPYEITGMSPGTPDYYLADGSGEAEVILFDNDEMAAVLNRNVDTESSGLITDSALTGAVSVDLNQGAVTLALPLKPDAYGPIYQGDDNLLPIIPIEMQLPDPDGDGNESVPGSMTATITFGDIEGATVTITNLNQVQSVNDTIRFVIVGPEDLASELRTGHYDYDVVFETEIDGVTVTRTVHGNTELFNRFDDEKGDVQYGKGWWVAHEDRLIPDDGTSGQYHDQGHATQSGVGLLRGDSTSAWYVADIVQGAVVPTVGEAVDGDWLPSSHATEGSQLFEYAEGGSYKWTASGLDTDKVYQVFATWSPGEGRTQAASYTISGITDLQDPDTSSITRTIDQRYTPGETLIGAEHYRSLGFIRPDSSSLTVNLSGGGELVASTNAVILVESWTYETPEGTLGRDSSESKAELVYDAQPSGEGGDSRPVGYTLENKFGTTYEFGVDGKLHQRVDRNKNMMRLEYNSDGLLESITEQGGLTTQYSYANQQINTITDFAGRAITYQVTDSIDRIIEPGDSQSATPETEFVYGGPEGRLSQVADAEGYVTSIEYDTNTKRVKSIAAPGVDEVAITPFLADGIVSTSSIEVRLPATGEIDIDAADSGGAELREAQAKFTDANGNDWFYQLDYYGLTIAMADPEDSVWKWERNDDGQATSMIEPAGGGGMANLGELTTTYNYDEESGNLESVEYAQAKRAGGGKITESWEYGVHNQVSEFTNARGVKTEYTLDPTTGNVTQITEFDTLQTAGGNRVTKINEYTASPSSINLLSGGLIKSITDAFGTSDAVTTLTEYWETGVHIGLVKRNTFASGDSNAESLIDFTYDGNRNLLTAEHPGGRDITYQHDDLDRLVSVTGVAPGAGTSTHSAPVMQYEYDLIHNVTALIDERGNRTDYEYDDANRLQRVLTPAPGGHTDTDQGRGKTEYRYDDNGNLDYLDVYTSGAEKRTTQYEYNSRNLLTKVTAPDPGYTASDAKLKAGQSIRPVTVYEYDSLGNLKWEIDSRYGATSSNSGKIYYEYDSIHRLEKVTSPTPNGAAQAPELTYVYNDDGSLWKLTAPSPQGNTSYTDTTYDYDSFGRLTSENRPGDGNGNQLTISYGYDNRDNLTSMTESDSANSRTTTNYYDALDRLIAVDGPDAGASKPGTSVYYSYNSLQDLSAQLVFAGDVDANHLSDAYISEGEIDAQQGVVWARTSNDIAQKMSYKYDDLGRVYELVGPRMLGSSTDNSQVTTAYTYDIASNVTQSKVSFSEGSGTSVLLTNTEFDNLNRAWKVLNPSTESGRPEQQTVFNFDGTTEKQLRKNPNDPDGWVTTQYQYDGLGRVHAVQSDDEAASSGTVTTTIWKDATGNTTRSRNEQFELETHYLYDDAGKLHLHRQQRAEVRDDDANYHYDRFYDTVYKFNHAGVVREIARSDSTEPSQAAIFGFTKYEYDNYGNVTKKTEQINGSNIAITDFEYGAFGYLNKIDDPESNVTNLTIDNLGRPTRDSTSFGNRDYQYDSFGNLTQSNDRNGRVIDFSYNNQGLLVKEDWGNGSSYVADFSYSPLGELLSADNPSADYGFTYNIARRLDKFTYDAAEDGEFTYDYDLVGNMSTVTADAATTSSMDDFVNTYTYDSRSRLKTAKQSADTGSPVLTKTVKYDYDYRTYTDDGTKILTTFTRRYENDGTGSVEASTKQNVYGDGWVSMVHHYEGDLPSAAVNGGSGANSVVSTSIEREFLYRNSRGLVTREVSGVYNSNESAAEYTTTINTYDDFGQLTHVDVTIPGPDNDYEQSFTYDDSGNRIGSEVDIGAHNRLKQDANNLYVYDSEGNLTRKWTISGDPIVGSTITSGSEALETSSRTWKSGFYRLDIGELRLDNDVDESLQIRIYRDGTLVKTINNVPLSYDSEEENWLVDPPDTVWLNLPDITGTIKVQIDDYGDAFDPSIIDGSYFTVKQFDRLMIFEYDHRNRMVEAKRYYSSGVSNPYNFTVPYYTIGGSSFTVDFALAADKDFTYDAFGQLIAESYDLTGGTSFDYTATHVVERGQRVFTNVVQEPINGTQLEQAYRLWAPGSDVLLAGEVVSIDSTPEERTIVWPLADYQGTISSAFIDGDAHTWETDSFGGPKLLNDGSINSDVIAMIRSVGVFSAGRHYDFDVDLYYNRARWFDAATGRFTSVDPAGFAAGDTNLYRYAFNSPANATDPTGQWINIAIGAGIGALVGGIGYALLADDFSWGGLAAAVGGGAVAGAVAGATFGLSLAAAGAVGLSGSGIAGAAGFAVASTLTGAVAGAAGGFVSGAINGLANGRDVWDSAIGGATAGLVYGAAFGLAFGLALPIAASLTGGGIVYGAISFVVASVLGDATSQGVGMLRGFQDGYDWRRTVFAGVTGALGGGYAGWRNPTLMNFANHSQSTRNASAAADAALLFRSPRQFLNTFRNQVTSRITARSQNMQSIGQDRQLRQLWRQSIREVRAADTQGGAALREYLAARRFGRTPTGDQARAAFTAVDARFSSNLRSAGIQRQTIHHWNWTISRFSRQAINPNNLFRVAGHHAKRGEPHYNIHQTTASVPSNPFRSPINPLHMRYLDHFNYHIFLVYGYPEY